MKTSYLLHITYFIINCQLLRCCTTRGSRRGLSWFSQDLFELLNKMTERLGLYQIVDFNTWERVILNSIYYVPPCIENKEPFVDFYCHTLYLSHFDQWSMQQQSNLVRPTPTHRSSTKPHPGPAHIRLIHPLGQWAALPVLVRIARPYYYINCIFKFVKMDAVVLSGRCKIRLVKSSFLT